MLNPTFNNVIIETGEDFAPIHWEGGPEALADYLSDRYVIQRIGDVVRVVRERPYHIRAERAVQRMLGFSGNRVW